MIDDRVLEFELFGIYIKLFYFVFLFYKMRKFGLEKGVF